MTAIPRAVVQMDLFTAPAVHHIVGLSGGKDSTAMALRLRELHPETAYEFVCTPTGNELPEMQAHWERLERILGQPLIHANAGISLVGLIAQQKAIPNWRMRWCTRKLKIEPFQAYVIGHLPAVTYVGIRADEAESREGVTDWGSTEVQSTFPLVEWGWNLGDVVDYLKANEIEIPQRTDCGLCFFQTLGEWHRLWAEYPTLYAQGETLEAWTGHTFRSPQRDTRPAALAELRVLFENGYTPKPRTMDDRKLMCSVCAR